MFITSLGQNADEEQGRVEALLGRQLTGLITTPIAADQSYLRPWQDRTTIVFIDRAPSKITADSVVEDDHSGAYQATEHLIGHGHRRIAFIGDTLATTTTARRLAGYRAALRDAGIAEDPRLVLLGPADGPPAIDLLLAWPSRRPPSSPPTPGAPSAIIPALQAAGHRTIPLISFGDFPLAEAIQPPPSVIDQDPVAVGRVAATRLFERIDHPGRRLKRTIVLPVPLIIRGSCCAGVAAMSRPIRRPYAVLISGAAGTGKSTLAAALAPRLGAAVLDLDVATGPLTELVSGLLGRTDLSDPEVAGLTRAPRYETLLALAEDNLRAGIPVVLVAPFTAERSPAGWAVVADRLGPHAAGLVLVWLDLPRRAPRRPACSSAPPCGTATR